jgi:hypothetical protein
MEVKVKRVSPEDAARRVEDRFRAWMFGVYYHRSFRHVEDLTVRFARQSSPPAANSPSAPSRCWRRGRSTCGPTPLWT